MAVGLTAKEIGLQFEIEIGLQQGGQGIQRQPCDHGRQRLRLRPGLQLGPLESGIRLNHTPRLQQRITAGGQTPGAQQPVGMLQAQELLITLENPLRIELTGRKQLIGRGIENQGIGWQFALLAALPAATLQTLLQRWFQGERREPERHCANLLLWVKLGAGESVAWFD